METNTPVIGSTAAPPPLVFTDAAAQKVSELIKEEDNPDLMLRVFVAGGGCSGFQYGFTFDESVEDGDSSIENQGVTLVVDPMSVQYLILDTDNPFERQPTGRERSPSALHVVEDLRLFWIRKPVTQQVELFRLYGASWWQSLVLLRLPGALPFLFSGLRTAAGPGESLR